MCGGLLQIREEKIMEYVIILQSYFRMMKAYHQYRKL